ncbi:MAG: choice-of-anchor D domain-containing protein [Candidatus Acidiferrales bacterium]
MKTRLLALAFLAALFSSPFLWATGQGSAPNDTEAQYKFGTHDIGTRSEPVAITLVNPSTSTVKFTIQSSAPDYEIESKECAHDVASKGACVVHVTFSPMAEGDRAGQLLVTYKSGTEGPSSSLSPIRMSGTGKLPDLGISSTRISFAPEHTGKTGPPETITLTNNSASELEIHSIVASGDFSFEGFHDPKKLKHGEAVVLVVRFTPSREGQRSGSLTIFSGAGNSPQNVYLFGSTPKPLSDFCAVPPHREFGLVLILCLLYWAAMVVVRWNRIALPTREYLRAELDTLETQLETLPSGKHADQHERVEKIKGLLQTAKRLIDAQHHSFTNRIANFLFWSRGQEMTGWGYAYEAQIHMVALLSPQTVVARLESNEQQLLMQKDAPSMALAKSIRDELMSEEPDVDRCKALLVEALDANFNREENSFSGLVSWQNKASWLVGCGLISILFLTMAIHHHSILFLVGAMGGLLSRLSRSLDRKDVPTDYGASWTTLFLSPVAGALGAWAGILISGLAVDYKVLGSFFEVDWANAPCQPTTLAIALAFGFSERLLDGVFDNLVKKTGAASSDDK